MTASASAAQNTPAKADSLAWLRPMIDHTVLAPETTREQVEAHLQEARDLGLESVCVSPSLLPVEKDGLHVVAVVGFPSGAHRPEVKALEASLAIADGADEIDMVINLGAVKAADWDAVARDITAVRQAVPAGQILKVIIESAALTDEEIVACSRIAEECGADFVKTSTGFHPAGGASVAAVRLMASVLGDDAKIKASGGIRTLEDARAYREAGASRFGVSASRRLLDGDELKAVGY